MLLSDETSLNFNIVVDKYAFSDNDVVIADDFFSKKKDLACYCLGKKQQQQQEQRKFGNFIILIKADHVHKIMNA